LGHAGSLVVYVGGGCTKEWARTQTTIRLTACLGWAEHGGRGGLSGDEIEATADVLAEVGADAGALSRGSRKDVYTREVEAWRAWRGPGADSVPRLAELTM
jgi:hypothetical protein